MIKLVVVLFAGNIQGPIVTTQYEDMETCKAAMPNVQVLVNKEIEEAISVKILCELPDEGTI